MMVVHIDEDNIMTYSFDIKSLDNIMLKITKQIKNENLYDYGYYISSFKSNEFVNVFLSKIHNKDTITLEREGKLGMQKHYPISKKIYTFKRLNFKLGSNTRMRSII